MVVWLGELCACQGINRKVRGQFLKSVLCFPLYMRSMGQSHSHCQTSSVSFLQVLKLILKMRQCWFIHIPDVINLVTLRLHFNSGLVLESSETGEDFGSHLIRGFQWLFPPSGVIFKSSLPWFQSPSLPL